MSWSDIDAVSRALVHEPLAVVMLYQSHCDWTNSTKPYLTTLADEHKFLLVRFNCDHLSPEFAGCSIPSVSVFRYGVQVSPPLRGARRRDALIDYLKTHGVIL